MFPKCYFDELTDGRMSFEAWIREAATLGGEGIEHYDGFFRSLAPEDVDPIARVLEDGLNGLDEMRRSVEFVKRKRAESAL